MAESSSTEEPRWNCSICEDRGFVAPLEVGMMPRPCPSCQEGKHVPDYFEGLTVQSDAYRDALDICKQWAKHPDGWLVLAGARGNGKTTLASAVFSTMAGKDKSVDTVAMMLDRWRSWYRSDDFDARFWEVASAHVAVLDDLGAERPTEWAVEHLGLYLDYRYARNLPTLITTNEDEDTLASRCGSRIADRVFDRNTGRVRLITLDGVSFRTGREW